MDLAELGLMVTSKSVRDGSSDLDKFSKSAHGAEKAADDFNESVSQGTKMTDRMKGSVNSLGTSFGGLKTLLGGIIAGFGVQYFSNLADTWSDLSSRVGVAIGDMDAADGVMARLTTTARLTYSTLGQTAEGFVRNSTVLQALGKSTQEQLRYTEALNLALVASGTKGQQALSVQEALSKGMTQGKLATEQLQTVLNGSSEVSKALADELGTTVLGLSALASQGQITGDVIYNTLTSRLEEFTEKAESMPATIGDGFLLIGNAVTALVGKFDQMIGASSTIAGYLISVSDALLWMGDNLDEVMRILIAVAPVMIAVFGPTMLAMVETLAYAVIGPLVKAILAFNAALLANPLAIVAAAVIGVVGYFIEWEVAIQNLIKAWAAFMMYWNSFWGDVEGTRYWIEIGLNAGRVVEKLKGAAVEAGATIANNFKVGGGVAHDNILSALDKGGTSVAEKINGTFEMNAERASAIYERLNGKLVEDIGETMVAGSNYLYNQVTGAVTKSGETASNRMEDSIKTGGTSAAQSMGQSIQSAGIAVGNSLFAQLINAGSYIGGTLGATMTDIAVRNAILQNSLLRAQASEAHSQARLNNTQARLAAAGRGGGDYSGGTSRRSSGGVSGTSFANAKPFALNPSPSVDTAPAPVVESKTTIVNVTDLSQALSAMETAKGGQILYNVIKSRREEFQNLLGIASS